MSINPYTLPPELQEQFFAQQRAQQQQDDYGQQLPKWALYSIRTLDYGSRALNYLWIPFILYMGCSSRYCGPTLDWRKFFIAPPTTDQQQQQR